VDFIQCARKEINVVLGTLNTLILLMYSMEHRTEGLIPVWPICVSVCEVVSSLQIFWWKFCMRSHLSVCDPVMLIMFGLHIYIPSDQSIRSNMSLRRYIRGTGWTHSYIMALMMGTGMVPDTVVINELTQLITRKDLITSICVLSPCFACCWDH
jgi:hypothetical protein